MAAIEARLRLATGGINEIKEPMKFCQPDRV
jgi:hypothetical protein